MKNPYKITNTLSAPILIISLLFFVGCNNKKDNKKSYPLQIISDQDYLLNENKEELLTYVDDIVKYDSSKIIIVEGSQKKLYITDLNLKILKEISFKDKDFLFRGRIFSATLHNNKIYLVDNSFTIKVLDLSSKKISTIEYFKGDMHKQLAFSIENISFLNDTIFVASLRINPDFIKRGKDFVIGNKYNINGNLISEFKVNEKEMGYNEYFFNSRSYEEVSYVAKLANKVIFSFEISKKVCLFSQTGKLKTIISLEVDKNVWQEPHKDEIGNYASTVTMHSLEVNNKNVFYAFPGGLGECLTIVKYDTNFHPISYFYLNGSIGGVSYVVKFIGNKFFVYSDNGVPIFKLGY